MSLKLRPESLFAPIIATMVATTLLPGCSAKNSTPQEIPKPSWVIGLRKTAADKPAPVDQSYDNLLDKEIEAQNLTRERFGELIAIAVRKRFPDYKITKCNADEIAFETPSKGNGVQYLENVWNVTKDSPGKRKELVIRFLHLFNELDDSRKLNIDAIVPIVRDEAYPRDAEAQMKQMATSQPANAGADKVAAQLNGSKLFFQPLAPGLVCLLAQDEPNSMRTLNEGDTKGLSIKEADIKGRLADNLLAKLPPEVNAYKLRDGVFMLTCGGDYESSLILSNMVMSIAAKQVKGKLIFSVPNRDCLYITGDADKNSVQSMHAMADESFHKYPRPISSSLYSWDNGKIELYQK